MPRPKRPVETRITSFRLPVELLDRLREAAEADRRSMAKAAEIAFERYIEQVEAEMGKNKAA